MLRLKKAIEQAYLIAESLGIAVWCEDEAGPYQTVPYPGMNWQCHKSPQRHPHEYFQEGTAKLLTLFHPASGRVRVKGVTNTRNETLHAWLQAELTAILDTLPEPLPVQDAATNRHQWERWREGVTVKATLSASLPPLRLLLIMDNLVGHKHPAWLGWCFQHGILPIYTPLSGSWLNMAESIQRILKRRALEGAYPQDVATIIARLEAVAHGWNTHPTPFIWHGKRWNRRQRTSARHLHSLGASNAGTRRPITRLLKWRRSCQLTH